MKDWTQKTSKEILTSLSDTLQGVLRLRKEASALPPSTEALGEMAASVVRAELPGPDPRDATWGHWSALLQASRQQVEDLARAVDEARRAFYDARNDLAVTKTATPLLAVWGCSLLAMGVAIWALASVLQDSVWELLRSQQYFDDMGAERDPAEWQRTFATMSLPIAASLLVGPTFASLLARHKHWLQKVTLVPELLFSGGFGLMRVGDKGINALAGSNSLFELSLIALHVVVVLVVREALPELRDRWDARRAARGKAAAARGRLRDARRELDEAREELVGDLRAMEARERAARQVAVLVGLAQSASRIVAAPESGPEGEGKKTAPQLGMLTGGRTP